MRYQMIFSFPLILVCTARRRVEGAAGAGAGDFCGCGLCAVVGRDHLSPRG